MRKPITRKPRRRRAPVRRQYRRNYRKNARARPMRALRTNYNSVNKYRFVRETTSKTITPSIIADGGGLPNMAYIQLLNITANDLPNWTEFSRLFQSYCIDKIVTYLIPLFETTESLAGFGGTPYVDSDQIMVTRINTQYYPEDYQVQATATAQRQELAQIQGKTRSLYGRKRWLKLTTWSPKTVSVVEDTVAQTPDVKVLSRGKRWIPTNDNTVVHRQNYICFLDKLDGTDIGTNTTNLPKYRTYTKVYFRCSQVQ